MTINSKIPQMKAEAEELVQNTQYEKQEVSVDKCMLLMQKAFNSGIETFIAAQASKAPTSVANAKEFNDSLSDAYVENQGEFLRKYIFDIIDNNSKNYKLDVAYKQSMKDDIDKFIKVIYDRGFMKGVEIAKDKQKLAIYYANKKRIEDGK